MLMKIILTDTETITDGDLSLEPIEQFGELQYRDLTVYEEIADQVKDADMILCNKTPLNEHTLAQAEHLQYIGLFATGYNNIDLAYCKKRGITVCNAGSYSTNAVAQHTFALILEHFSKVGDYGSFVEDGGWMQSNTFSKFIYPTQELYGKTIGLVGFGAIAQAVAKIALAFGMSVLSFTRSPKTHDSVCFVSFEELLAKSDIISVHCPLNEASRNMFDAEAFKKCKDGAYFVNTARGAIVDEEALLHVLESGKLSGAGVDVLRKEPMRPDCPLLHAPNITITPHVAWAPMETRRRLLQTVLSNIRAFLDGAPQNVVTG